MIKNNYKILFIFIILTASSLVFAKYHIKPKIGTVTNTKGTVLALKNFDKTIQYLKPGDSISRNVMVITRENAQAIILLDTNEEIVLAPGAKITLTPSKASRSNLHLILHSGTISLRKRGVGPSSLYFSFLGAEEIMYGNAFEASMKSGISDITPINGEEIYLLRSEKKPSEEELLPEVDVAPPVIAPEVDLPSSDSDDDLADEVASMFGDDSTSAEPEKVEEAVSTEEDEIEGMFGEDNSSEVTKKDVPSKSLPSMSGKINVFSWEPFEVDEEASKKFELNWFDFEKSIYLRSNAYMSAPPTDSKIDNQAFHIDARLFFKNKLNLSKSSSFTYAGWLQGTNRKNVQTSPILSIDYRKEKRSIFSFNEFFYLKSFTNFDLTVGKKVVRFGKGMIYSPSDRISPSDSIVPTNPLALGTFIGSLDYYLGNSKFTFLVAPYFVPSKTAPTYSRWSQSIDGSDIQFETIYPEGFGVQSVQTLTKFETTLSGWDLFAAIFNGPNPDPVLKNEITVENNEPRFTVLREHIHVTNLSAGFSTTFGAMEVHGEVLRQNASEGKDDSYMVYMGGFRYSFDSWPNLIGLDQIDVVMEYAKEDIFQPITYPFYLFSSVNSRVFQNTLVGAIIFKVSDNLTFSYNFNKDFQNNGLVTVMGGAYNFVSSGQITLNYESYSGSEDSLFGKWDKNDNVVMEYIYEF